MAEYIDIEPLRKQIVEFKTAVKQFAKSSSFLKAYISGIDAVMEAIDKLPTADVQEVVRCRDCKFNDNCSVQYYAMFKNIDYCSRGIKKDGDDNDKNRI